MAQNTNAAEVVDRFRLKVLREACLLLEEGAADAKDIDLGVMMGTGIQPGPLAAADFAGLDTMLESMTQAEKNWGPWFDPPTILKRLVSQGRLGQKVGEGFFPYAQPDADFEQKGKVLFQTKGSTAILWLNDAPMNSLGPDVIQQLAELLRHCAATDAIRSVIITSSTPFTFCAGANIKAFTSMDPAQGREMLDLGHAALRELEESSTVTIAAVNSIAFGGGNELAMACDFRIAAVGATFGQPEINLGIMPGLGGTQRLPRLVGEGRALEMNLTGEPISAELAHEWGLVNLVVPGHELMDTALSWAKALGRQAPVAVQQIKKVSNRPDLDQGLADEQAAFGSIFATEDAKEGITAFLQKRQPNFQGK